MSDFNLIDIVNLIRAEIRKTQVGPVKKITGKTGERGPQGEAGIQGPQGPRGNDGARGPIGPKGNQGKKGDKGVKGDDGKDGVGIARVEQDIDNAIVVYLTDGNFYTIEMPLIDADGNLGKEIHYKVGGSGGSGGGEGTVDLSGYVRRPSATLNGESWLVYRENGGAREWAAVTTDLVSTNPEITFRDAKGKFRSTKDLEDLTDQLKVNRFVANELDALNEAIENIDFPEGADLSGFATKEELDASTSASAERDAQIIKHIDEVQEELLNSDKVLELYAGSVDKSSKARDEDLQSQINELAAGDVDLSPVEDRLDEIEGVLPKAPTIIPPVEIEVTKTLVDADDRPTGTGKPPMENVLMWHMDAGREATVNQPANEMKTQIPNAYLDNIILDGTTEVWFKQGERVQKWNCLNGGWFTGTNLWHLSAQSTEGDDLVAGAPVEFYYIDPFTEGDDLIDAISRLESKADDRRLQAEIEVLSGQLSTLVKHQEDGEWEYKGELPERPRNAGEFTLATATLTSENNSLLVYETDLDGITHSFTAPVGSYIEIVDIEDPMDYVLFEVTREPDGTGLIQIDVKMVKAGNEFEIDDRCIIRFFEVGEGLDINELDRRYLQLAGGTMKGSIRFLNGANLSFVDEEGQAWTQFKSGKTTEYVGQYSGDNAIATKKRITEAVAGLASEEWVTEQIEGIEIPDGSKSITTTQMMMGAYSYFDMPAGRFTLVQSNQSSPTLDPSSAYGVRFYPAQEWWEATHEPIAGGYITVTDPFDGKVRFGGKVDRVEKDNSASNRWSFFVPFGQYRNGDTLSADRQYLLTLSGCLREK